MSPSTRLSAILLAAGSLSLASVARAQDWPQFRGANRDGKISAFSVPATWPKALSPKWKIAIGDGDATPALVGDKVFVFSRQDGKEVTRCLDATTGKEVWSDQYTAAAVNGPAAAHSGPRSSPAVADGKVVTLGVHGTLSCLNAGTGKVLWRKADMKGEPRFSVSSSPMIVGSLCVAQLGATGNGGIVAYDLASGDEKWKWTGDAPAYASPVVMTIGDARLIIAETEKKIVAINAADGKDVWETPFAAGGMGAYNAATPVVDNSTLIYSGGSRGTHAVKIEKQGDAFSGKELWSNADESVQFSTPVVKDGFIYGLSSSNVIFCLDEQTGKAAWNAPLTGGAAAAPPANGGGGAGGGRRMGGRGGMGGGGYGSIVDAGTVLVALSPKSELVVFKPDSKAYGEVARIKVADSETYAYPILSGNRIVIKDKDSVALLTVE